MRNTETQYRNLLVEGVKTTGYSRLLGLGEFGFADFSKPTPKGYPLLKTFDSVPKDGRIILRGGSPERTVGKETTKADIGSLPFRFDEVTNFYVEAPKSTEIKVDKMILGYNGKEGTGFKLNKDSYLTIGIELFGPALGFAGYEGSRLFIQEQVYAPRELPQDDNFVKGVTYPTTLEKRTMTEIIEDAVERILEKPLMNGQKVGDLIKLKVISTDAPEITGENFVFWHLNVPCDNGSLWNLGKVQAQYPDYVIKKDEVNISDNYYSYVAILPEGETPEDYVKTLTNPKLDCGDCADPATNVFHYTIIGDIAEADLTTAGITADNFVELGPNSLGQTVSSFETAEALGAEEYEEISKIEGFISLSEPDVSATECSGTPTESTFAWTKGETCTAVIKTYEIRVPDTDCGTTRFAELQEFYGEDFTITEVPDTNKVCMRSYRTTVMSNIECDECSTDIYAIYNSESPKDFGTSIWKEVKTRVYAEDAEVGIYIEGKKFLLTAEEDGIATTIGSTEIKNIYASDRMDTMRVTESWANSIDIHKEWLQRASIPDGLGYESWKDTIEGQYYFTGTRREKENNLYNYLHGKDNLGKPLTPYVYYYLTIQKYESRVGFAHVGQNVTYEFMVEVGKHRELEEVLNSIAIKAGLDPVQAYK